MIKRCRANREHDRYYRDCSISDNFKDFQYFAAWCNQQIGFNSIEELTNLYFNLDKDILVKNNRVYSEDICVFVPGELNRFFCKGKAIRGKFPIGVDFQKRWNSYRARCNDGNKNVYLGAYKTPEEAFLVYKNYKENKAKELAIKFNTLVDERVINALNNFKVEIND